MDWYLFEANRWLSNEEGNKELKVQLRFNEHKKHDKSNDDS